jgi:hypothetical protein
MYRLLSTLDSFVGRFDSSGKMCFHIKPSKLRDYAVRARIPANPNLMTRHSFSCKDLDWRDSDIPIHLDRHLRPQARRLAVGRSTLLHECGSTLADFLERHFKAAKLLRA